MHKLSARWNIHKILEFMTNKIFNWQIIGHQKILKILQTAIIQNKLAHAYLFYGLDGLGKSTLAKYFIASLICNSSPCPCQKCINCQQIFQEIHPDLLIIKRLPEKKEISIEQIRFLKNWLSLSPFSNPYKFVILKEAENLNREASNSFLKILEEPPKNSIIVIITKNLKSVLPTIISRCQLVKFNPVSQREMIEYYEHMRFAHSSPTNYESKRITNRGPESATERYNSNLEKIKELIPYSFGRPGLLINFLEEQNLFNQYKSQSREFVELFQSSLKQKLEYAEKNFSNPLTFLWLRIIHDFLLVKINLPPVNKFLETDLKRIVGQYSKKEISNLLIELNLAKKYLSQNLNPKLVLENFFINL